MIIFDNYDLKEQYSDEDIKEMALECGWVDEDEEITEQMIWDWRYQINQDDWDDTKYELEKFFKDKVVGFFGTVGTWHGRFAGGRIGEFWETYYKAIKDCDYIQIEDKNGHMYLRCSHHDGTNFFEIKEITERGQQYLENWKYGCDDRTTEYCFNQISKRYSRLPRFAKTVYGC